MQNETHPHDESTAQNKARTQNSKGPLFKILIVLVIVLAIGVVWFAKNLSALDTSAQNSKARFPLRVTEPFDLEELKSYGLPILIDFGSDSCPNCQKMAPALEELNAEYQDEAIILFADVWKYESLATGLPIRTIPAQILITSDGEPYTPSEPLQTSMQFYTSEDTGEHILTVHEGLLDKPTMLKMLQEMGLEK